MTTLKQVLAETLRLPKCTTIIILTQLMVLALSVTQSRSTCPNPITFSAHPVQYDDVADTAVRLSSHLLFVEDAALDLLNKIRFLFPTSPSVSQNSHLSDLKDQVAHRLSKHYTDDSKIQTDKSSAIKNSVHYLKTRILFVDSKMNSKHLDEVSKPPKDISIVEDDPTEHTDSDSENSSVSGTSYSWENVKIVEPHTEHKKVLVTGGAGFIGSHVADYLLNRGDDVVIVDEMNDYYDVRIKEGNLKLLREKYGNDRLKIYKGDICDEVFMTEIFEMERPGWVCHMAARAGVRPSIQDPFIYIHSNIKGTTLLLQLSARFGVQNFVFASSSSVYGGSKSTYFSEDEVVDNPVSPYAATKKACELMAYTYHHLYKLNVAGLRFFTVYGPRGRPDMAPFKFLDQVSRGAEIQQFGDGSSSRDYTYIDDIVDGIVRSIDRPYPYQIFNLGKGTGNSLTEFIELVQLNVGKKAQVKILPDQPGDVPYTCADVSKAERLLGYQSKISFEEGIRRTALWYKEAYCQPSNEDNGQENHKSYVSSLIQPQVQILTTSAQNNC